MVIAMQETAIQDNQKASLNPDWLPERIPLWMSIGQLVKLLPHGDRKSLGERAKRLGVDVRVHPYDKRKRQINMMQFLARLDFDIESITFTTLEPPKAEPVKPTIRKQKPKAIAYVGNSTLR